MFFGGKIGGKWFYFGGKYTYHHHFECQQFAVKPTNQLTELSIKQAKPKEKQYKLTDGEGMYLRVYPNGSKYWLGQQSQQGVLLQYDLCPDGRGRR